MHSSEGLGPLTVHLEHVVGVGLGADLTLGDEDNDAAVELLLELLGELGLDPIYLKKMINDTKNKIPYLCLLVEEGGEGAGVDDGDGLLVGIDIDEGGRDDLELLEVLLDLLGGLGLDLLDGGVDLDGGLGERGGALHSLGGHCGFVVVVGLVNIVFTFREVISSFV